MLPSVNGTNARRTMSFTTIASKTAPTASSMRTRMGTGGSKNQSTASEAQKAKPSHAAPLAMPSVQTYCRMRRRKASSNAWMEGATGNVFRRSRMDMELFLDVCISRFQAPPGTHVRAFHEVRGANLPAVPEYEILIFYANFTNRRISHSKHNRPHSAIIIHWSHCSSDFGSGASGWMTVVVRSFSSFTSG